MKVGSLFAGVGMFDLALQNLGHTMGRPMFPTPVASDDGKSPEAHMRMKERMPGGPRRRITSLAVLARGGFVQPDGSEGWTDPDDDDAIGHTGWDDESMVSRTTNTRGRAKRLTAIGNALVPQVAESVAQEALRVTA